MSETNSYAAIDELLPGLPKLVEELKRLGFGVLLEVDRVGILEFHIKLVISNFAVDIDTLQAHVEAAGMNYLVSGSLPEYPLADDEIPF